MAKPKMARKYLKNCQVDSYADGYFTVRLDRIEPESHKPFKQVRDQVREKWKARQRRLNNLEKAKQTLKKLNSGELRLGKVARQNNRELLEFNNFKRKQAPQDLTRNAVIRAFKLNEGEYGYVSSDNAVIFMKLSAINMQAANALDEKKLEQARSTIQKQFQNELMSRYIDYLRDQYDVSINRDLLKRRYAN